MARRAQRKGFRNRIGKGAGHRRGRGERGGGNFKVQNEKCKGGDGSTQRTQGEMDIIGECKMKMGRVGNLHLTHTMFSY